MTARGTPLDAETESGTDAGRRVVAASWAGTAVFAVAAAVGATKPDPLESTVTVVSLVLFAAGVAAFLWSFGKAVGRSRTEQISVAGLWFLSGGSAPPATRRTLLASFAVQVVIAIVAASVRPYTEVAFGVLVPVYGLGLCGVWGAAHGTFPGRGQ